MEDKKDRAKCFPNQFHFGFQKSQCEHLYQPIIEISHVIYSANQIIGFNMKCNTEMG